MSGVSSGQNLVDHLPSYVSETEVAPIEEIGEAFVVDTEEVQDGGMEVVDVDSVFHSFVAEFVTCSVVGTSLDASSGHPHGEGVGIMVSTLTALRVGGAPEFPSPDHEGILEHSPGLEVGKKGADWLVDALSGDPVIGPDVVVTVPWNVGHSSSSAVGAGVELHETDPSLD